MTINNVLENFDDVLDPKDVQAALHIGRNAVYKLLSDGTIKSIRVSGKYRIPKLYLIEFIYGDSFTNVLKED